MEDVQKIVEKILEEKVDPRLKKHGGSIELEKIRGSTAYVKFTGQCSGCPSARYTLESIVKDEITARTDLIKDVKLQEKVSHELYEFAKHILSRDREGRQLGIKE